MEYPAWIKAECILAVLFVLFIFIRKYYKNALRNYIESGYLFQEPAEELGTSVCFSNLAIAYIVAFMLIVPFVSM